MKHFFLFCCEKAEPSSSLHYFFEMPMKSKVFVNNDTGLIDSLDTVVLHCPLSLCIITHGIH